MLAQAQQLTSLAPVQQHLEGRRREGLRCCGPPPQQQRAALQKGQHERREVSGEVVEFVLILRDDMFDTEALSSCEEELWC